MHLFIFSKARDPIDEDPGFPHVVEIQFILRSRSDRDIKKYCKDKCLCVSEQPLKWRFLRFSSSVLIMKNRERGTYIFMLLFISVIFKMCFVIEESKWWRITTGAIFPAGERVWNVSVIFFHTFIEKVDVLCCLCSSRHQAFMFLNQIITIKSVTSGNHLFEIASLFLYFTH